MGRVKLEIKKIENATNRQVTFSKRRNGLMKKAYELSVLCDVDVALFTFSPSGRVSIFSGHRSVEEILLRFVNLPEHERGRLQNQEYLQRFLGKLKAEADPTYQAHPTTMMDAQVEEIQKEVLRCKCQLMDMERRLRIYEGDPSEIATLCDAEYREQVLEEKLSQIKARKHVLQEQYSSPDAQTVQVLNMPPETNGVNILAARNPENGLFDDWLPQRDPQVQILNFLDSNGLLQLRDQPGCVDSIMTPSLTRVHAPNVHVHSQVSPSRSMEDDIQRHEFGEAIDVNLAPWDGLYATVGGVDPFPTAQPRERALLELISAGGDPFLNCSCLSSAL